MHNPHGPVYYSEYLQLDKLLNSQLPKSKDLGSESHDEMLFIIVHQAYELWFKQILHELNSILCDFSKPKIEERELLQINNRLERVTKIQTVLMEQIDILLTMTPMDFLEFRDLLVPASGFQSVQFREIEVKMGLRTDKRQNIDREFFVGRLNDKDKEKILEIEKQESLLSCLEKWLERMPFANSKDFDFWNEYESAIKELLKNDEKIILQNLATLSDKAKEIQLENLKLTKETFQSLLNKKEHEKLLNEGKRSLSQKAMLNALFILLYRDEPILHDPYRLLKVLMDIDENFTNWRNRHAIMAQRMLGTKIGTGGSSGHRYLKMAAENNKVFQDLFNLSTFIIPRSLLPKLPKSVQDQMGFHFSTN